MSLISREQEECKLTVFVIKAIAYPLVGVIESVVLRHPACIVLPNNVLLCVDGEATRVLIVAIDISVDTSTRLKQRRT